MNYYPPLSAAEEDAFDPGVEEQMQDRARAALIEQCNTDDGNKIRAGWLDFCETCLAVTAEQFIGGLEEVGQEWWEEAVAQQWDNLYEAI